MSIITNQVLESYPVFIQKFKDSLAELFTERNQDVAKIHQRGFSQSELKQIMDHTPLSVAIPTEFGGRGVVVKECLGMLEAASYESLSLSLMFGINFALFLEPFGKYGQDSIKQRIFSKFLNDQNMGGLMISEPNHGSDALNMQTKHEQIDGHFKINGTKHWQGLTGMADFWLVASRQKTSSGQLSRDIDLFVTDQSHPDQQILVEEYYNNYGLYPIPYGKNKIDIKVPESHRLIPETTGIKVLMDLLHRSRMQFPGMAVGFLRRIMEEATKYCRERMVRGNSLLQFDKVKQQIAQLQSAFTVCSAMCFRSAKVSGVDQNLALSGIEANSIKAYVTDLMQNSAQTLTQLMGGIVYKIESIGSRAIMDSRPFRIFEGPNEMLFSQISEMIVKKMKRNKNVNLFDYVKQYELTDMAAEYFKSLLNFNVEFVLPQRKHFDLGQILSRVISAKYVMELGAAGFDQQLISNALVVLKQDVSVLLSSFKSSEQLNFVEEFKGANSWRALIS